jgi:23S rRNA pseudouridine1911/1915/1917 synthase
MSAFQVLYEDNHLLVVNKPALLPTMGVEAGEDSLVRRGKAYLKQKYHKPGNVYLGVVSRLDARVSGVIVLAKTSKSAARLNDQFRQRLTKKTYLAIVPDRGNLPERGELRHRLYKDEKNHRMVGLPEDSLREGDPKNQLAILSFDTRGRYNKLRLLEIGLETGRKHQIRVQLSQAGCPIVGDQKYGSPLPFPAGIALHSSRLEFEHPTGRKWLSFSVDPPDCWQWQRFDN